MHEAATAQALADLVLRKADERKARRVVKVELEIGELSFLELEQLRFWLEANFEGTIAQGAELAITLVEPLVKCGDCDYVGRIQVEEDPAYHFMLPRFTCPHCGSARLRVEKGRESTIRRIELELVGDKH